ncbi:MAG: LuxR C-terminal-related transcriptional regulator [Paludibacteraceae bacterium]|nr:LuxR C-terminal-related transcriptional regulator [Paludibacteraceae bacterium]
MKIISLRNFLIFVFLITTNIVYANIAVPVTNYSTEIYNAGTQNWCIRTHTNGWVYFANNDGLLEYDGKNWETYKIEAANAVVRAIEIDYANNMIYAGGDNEYGYYSPNALGALEYHSMYKELPDSLKEIGQVWGIITDDNCIYVRSDYKLLKHNTNGTVTEIQTKGHVYGIVKSGGTIFVESQNGLGILTGNKINSVQGNELIKDKVVRSVCSYINGGVLVATQKDGIYIYDGESIKPFHTEIDNILKDDDLFSIASDNRHIAFGFINKGVAVTNIKGTGTIWFNTKNGLANNTILNMTFDKIGNLWLGLDNGIDLVSFGSPIKYMYGREDFIGAGYAACEYKGALYVGTNQGVFVSTNHGANFKAVKGCSGQIWSLDIIDNSMLCSSDNGLFILENGTLAPINTSTGYWRARKMGKSIIAGRYSGFVTLSNTNGAYSYKKLKGIDINPRLFEIDDEGHIILALGNKLLCGTVTNDSICYTHIADAETGTWSVQKIGNAILVSSPTMVAIVNKDATLNTNCKLIENLKGTYNYSASVKDRKGNLWFIVGDTIFTRNEETGKIYSFMDNTGLRVAGFESIYALSDNTILVGSHKGFILPDTSSVKAYDRENVINPIVRRITLTTAGDSVIYGQSFTMENKTLEIDYIYNSLRFLMGGAGNSANSQIQFAYMLEPLEKQYGKYTSNNSKEYTTLKEGHYTLHIKSKSSFTNKEGYTSVEFTIKPPFYRSWWAYLIYAIVISVVSYMLYLIILNKQRQSRRKLELEKDREILACQRSLNEERLIKEKEILTLKNEQTEINLKLKTKELANITLSRINHNDTLSNIKADLKKISAAIKNGDYNSANSKIIALQTSISENMDTDVDWNKFEDDFNVTHFNFITKLKEAYPNFTKKEIKLCVYIKMGLLTKEIAPLMNISIRGVEMLRFRMRKKMNVKSDVDLTTLFERL